jgi:outer membrane protein assembly factor BamB
VKTNTTLALISTAAFVVTPALAQRGGPDWTTSAGDPQRTSWVRVDPQVNAEKENKLGFEKLWTLKMAGTEGQPSEPIMISTYIGYRGFKALAVVSGPNYLYTADYDLGRFFYDQHYKSTATASAACAAFPSAVGKLSSLTPVPPRAGRQSNSYHTVTGKPHEGVSLEAAMGGQLGLAGIQRAAPAQAMPPGIRFAVPIFLVTSDGMARAITFDSGKETYKPVQFLPSGSAASDLIVVQDTLYAATMPGCGSSPNSIFALDVSTPNMRPLGSWKAPSGNVLGAPAFNKAGVIFVSTDKGVYAVKPKSLEGTLVGEATVTSTPVIITGKDREWVAVGTKDGIALMSATGEAATPVKTSVSGFTPTALAAWDDTSGTHWLLATDDTKSSCAIHAFKVTDKGLELAWTSADMEAPARPIIVDGVVFALSTGADRSGNHAKPATKGTHATLYALDASTGKALWNSGNDITSFVSSGGLSFNEGQVYLATHDNTLYAFGKPDPRQ